MPCPIEDYAIIGDCQTIALVSRGGSLDWLCWPSFDSEACFAALLGNREHGHWLIAPRDEPVSVTRSYRRDTLILETRFECKDGIVTLIDFMPPRGQSSDIVRLIRGDKGSVEMSMEFIVRFGFGTDIPWVKRLDDMTIQAIAGPDMVVLRSPVRMSSKDMSTVAEFQIEAGDTLPFVLGYVESYRPMRDPIDPAQALADTETFWLNWSARSTYKGKYQELIQRSLITLKALTFAPTGGIVAAPTASLPEKLGGSRNWDYRYCWLRDATFTLLALVNNGYHEEAADWHNWLLRATAGSPANIQIMYSITGRRRLLEWEAKWLPGYEGAKPVRFGNAAFAQLQLDVYGELLDTFHQARIEGVELSDTTWAFECELLRHLATIWHNPDSGLWEHRGPGEHYVLSKVMCWVAFDRAIKSAQNFGFEAPLEEWCAVRDRIHQEVCSKGYDVEQATFVEYYGSSSIDASLLLIPAVGFLDASDPRITGTLEAIERHLMRNGLVLRHDPRQARPGEAEPIEGAFLACTLWLADVCVLRGEIAKAQELFERVADLANDVGLISEEYDTIAKRQTGNFPQALSHIALVNTSQNIYSAQHSSKKPAVQRTAR